MPGRAEPAKRERARPSPGGPVDAVRRLGVREDHGPPARQRRAQGLGRRGPRDRRRAAPRRRPGQGPHRRDLAPAEPAERPGRAHRRPARLDGRQHRVDARARHPGHREGDGGRATARSRPRSPPSAARSPVPRPGPSWPSSPARSSGSTTSPPRAPPGSCSWRPTSCRPSASSRSTRSDFRLWVAMHEETHRVQFTAVPWLRDHLIERTRDLTIDVAPTPAELAGRLQEIARRLPEAFQPGSQGLAEVLLTPEQRAKVEAITAVMALLEGHADVMMDEVGPQVIPTVAAHPHPVHRAPAGRLRLRPDPAPGARPRGQDAAVLRRGRLRARCRRPGRARRLQRRLDVARDAADARRDRRPGGLGPARPRRHDGGRS